MMEGEKCDDHQKEAQELFASIKEDKQPKRVA